MDVDEGVQEWVKCYRLLTSGHGHFQEKYQGRTGLDITERSMTPTTSLAISENLPMQQELEHIICFLKMPTLHEIEN